MANIKDENYIIKFGWMINKLNLKGNDLEVYAIIYGFTQDNNNWFEGSQGYLAKWCNCTNQGIGKNLKNLLSRNLIIKAETPKGSVCKYKCNPNFFPSDSIITENTPRTPRYY